LDAILAKIEMKEQKKKLLTSSILSLGGIGFTPFAPGTFGSLLSVALLYFIKDFSRIQIILLCIIIFLLSIPASFILFRFFDILKPPPIKQIDKKLKGGLGVMFDDVVAGIFAGVILLLLKKFIFPA